jgi:Outer membrane protein beta-barrel domain
MKRAAFLFSLLTAAVGTAKAQQTPTIFGFKGGVTYSSYAGDVEAAEYRAGFHGGLILKLPVSKSFAVQPELLYSMKGAQGSETVNGYSKSYEERLHYVDVPILAKIFTAQGLFFEAGPQLGVMLAARGDIAVTGPGGRNGSASGSIKSEFKDVDLGLAVGLGLQVPDTPLLMGVRYNGGLVNIVKDYGDKSLRNTAFQFYIGFLFGEK